MSLPPCRAIQVFGSRLGTFPNLGGRPGQKVIVCRLTVCFFG